MIDLSIIFFFIKRKPKTAVISNHGGKNEEYRNDILRKLYQLGSAIARSYVSFYLQSWLLYFQTQFKPQTVISPQQPGQNSVIDKFIDRL